MSRTTFEDLKRIIDRGSARVGVVGLGYVGLPLAIEFGRAKFRVFGFDRETRVVDSLNMGQSHIKDVPDSAISAALACHRTTFTTDLSLLAACDVIVICVPTPLSKVKDPDLTFVISATRSIKENLRSGQLVILESTTYPGTTREAVLPILESSGLSVGVDYFVCFSPERVDPGNPVWNTRNTPKVIGGATDACLAIGSSLYQRVFDVVVPVSTLETAELTKVYENTFRLINIALANELAQECEKLGVDVWEVIEAASTKPFGFMTFFPGPGIGGHCIPLDPHYLSWKMRTLSYKTRMIEAASEINAEMPGFVVQRIIDALNEDSKPVRGSSILILGAAYKRDVADYRESAALEIIRQLQAKGGRVDFHDPFCPEIEVFGGPSAAGHSMRSVPLSNALLRDVDVVVIVTDHSGVDYAQIANNAMLIVDTRGVLRSCPGNARVVGLSDGITTTRVP